MNLMRLSGRESRTDLEVEARAVEGQIKRLEHRPRPTPSEQKLTADLKRMRLAVKDRLVSLTSSQK